MNIKDMIGITVGASLLSPVMSGIGAGFTGSLAGLGSATQTLVGAGFLGEVKSKVKFFK